MLGDGVFFRDVGLWYHNFIAHSFNLQLGLGRRYARGMDISLRHEGPVAVLTWNDGENRLNADSLARLNELLDELEATSGPLAIVVTGVGKFFSNGLDLARFGAIPAEFSATLGELERTIGRLLLFPAYTVAALNGHTFAGGALLSCAFDYRVMREDRGYWCMNEAEIGLALDEKLWSIIEHRLPRATAVVAATTAKRFTGPDALAAGIVEATTGEGELLGHAIEVASRYAALDRTTLSKHKYLAHGEEATLLGWRT
jgi:enoyl-CoA hydratase/carnithine racemase